MNERFLSRGKREDNGAWETGFLVIKRWDCSDERYFITDKMTGYHTSVIPKTVGKGTELKDKHGKMIFKGDILESRASENKEDWKRWVVTFSDGSFCFEREIPRKRKYKYEQNLLGIDNIELYGLTVIGNVHDNPKLLQRSDENEKIDR